MKIYKTVIWPVVTYRSETWVMNLINEGKLKIFERKTIRSIYGPVQDLNNERRVRANQEINSHKRRKYSSIHKIPETSVVWSHK
jgi:hypothetical protein